MNLINPSWSRRIALFLAAPLLLALTGCGGSSVSTSSNEATEQSVSKYEEAIANNKTTTLKKPAKAH